MVTNNKVVIFDLDDTLGYFVQIGVLNDCLEEYFNRKLSMVEINNLIEMNNEVLRPFILNILQYLKEKKEQGKCLKVMIYTNNQGPKTWVESIKNYFNNKLNYNLFDNIIAAFKVNGKKIEMNRTSHNKKVSDIYRCVELPKNVKLCFIDDQYHEEMIDNSVYYINVEPYTYDLNFDIMLERYYKFYNLNDYSFFSKMENLYKKFNFYQIQKSKEELKIDKIVSKKLFQHIKFFFNKSKNITIKKRKTANKTKKK